VTGLLKLTLALKGSPLQNEYNRQPHFCGSCHTQEETASHILSECVALAKLRFCQLGKHFMTPSDYDEIPLCKVPYFIRGLELLVE
jgi:hypothetical protein